MIGGGAELGSTLFHDGEEPNVTRLRRRTGPRQRSAAASQEHDEDLHSDDYEVRLLASGIANPGGAEHLEWIRLQACNHGEEF